MLNKDPREKANPKYFRQQETFCQIIKIMCACTCPKPFVFLCENSNSVTNFANCDYSVKSFASYFGHHQWTFFCAEVPTCVKAVCIIELQLSFP